jgi:hypothetical protein
LEIRHPEKTLGDDKEPNGDPKEASINGWPDFPESVEIHDAISLDPWAKMQKIGA